MIPLKTALFSLLVVGTTLTIPTAGAAVADRIVAVVNDSVLTQQDVDKRFQLTMRQIKKHPSKAQQIALYNDTLNKLIQEEVQYQYATERGLRISKKEMDLAIATIEKTNKLSKGGFFNLTKGLTDTAKRRVETELLWEKVINKIIRPNVKVTPQEVDQLITNISGTDAVVEKELYQILVKDTGKSPELTEKEINEIYENVKENKGSFLEAARLHSEDASAKNNGFMGWFKDGELQITLNRTLADMAEGDISKPVKTKIGWHILYVKNERTSVKFSKEPVDAYSYDEMIVTLPKNKEDAEALRKGIQESVRKFKLKGDMEEFVLKNKEKMDITGGTIKLLPATQMSSVLLNRLKNINLQSFSKIQEDDGKLSLIYLGSTTKVLPSKLQKYRANIHQRLMANRLDMSVKRFSREIRRNAYVDIRN